MESGLKIPPPDTYHSGQISFSGKFTIENAAEIQAALLKAMAASPHIELDISGINEIDLIGMQIICSLHRTAQEHGFTIQVSLPLPGSSATFAREAGFSRNIACLKGVNSSCIWSNHNGPAK